MIYFLQAEPGGPVKIGHSGDIEARRLQLEAVYRRPLEILATMEGDRPEEAEIHRRFAHLRIGRTEQFRPTPDLMAFIGRPLLVGANPDAVEAMEPSWKSIALCCGTDAFAEWFNALADHCGMPATILIAQAVKQYATNQGFAKPMPRR